MTNSVGPSSRDARTLYTYSVRYQQQPDISQRYDLAHCAWRATDEADAWEVTTSAPDDLERRLSSDLAVVNWSLIGARLLDADEPIPFSVTSGALPPGARDVARYDPRADPANGPQLDGEDAPLKSVE